MCEISVWLHTWLLSLGKSGPEVVLKIGLIVCGGSHFHSCVYSSRASTRQFLYQICRSSCKTAWHHWIMPTNKMAIFNSAKAEKNPKEPLYPVTTLKTFIELTVNLWVTGTLLISLVGSQVEHVHGDLILCVSQHWGLSVPAWGFEMPWRFRMLMLKA